jgi:Bacterial aa3 type cytochrome c oxidase subunit IV
LSKAVYPVKAASRASFRQEENVAGNQDIRAAKDTYSGFLTLFKWGAIASAAIGLLVILIIA